MNAHRYSLLSVALSAGFASCTTDIERTESSQAIVTAADPSNSALVSPIPQPVVLSTEPWTYASAPGSIVRTRHYRIYTTMRDVVLLKRTADFLERALVNYRTALTPLPGPPQRLDTYLMANRPQWRQITRQLLGPSASGVLQISRGGYAARGIGVYYDLGLRDTLAIAAHEGWHQYTQRTFADQLPVWLEEGLATYMEGHRWAGPIPVFRSWSNTERFDELRAAHAEGRLFTLAELLEESPNELTSAVDGSGLTYYAQVWALAHFLAGGADGRYAASLKALVSDAQRGTMGRVLRLRLEDLAARASVINRSGSGVFLAYFNTDLDVASQEYESFVAQIVAMGSRTMIVEGKSPIQ